MLIKLISAVSLRWV